MAISLKEKPETGEMTAVGVSIKTDAKCSFANSIIGVLIVVRGDTGITTAIKDCLKVEVGVGTDPGALTRAGEAEAVPQKETRRKRIVMKIGGAHFVLVECLSVNL